VSLFDGVVLHASSNTYKTIITVANAESLTITYPKH